MYLRDIALARQRSLEIESEEALIAAGNDTSAQLDNLSEDEANTVESAINDQTEIFTGKGPQSSALSTIVNNSPKLNKEITLYRYYDSSKLQIGSPLYSFTEPGFILGTTQKPPARGGSVIFAFKLSPGLHALQLSNNMDLLDKGFTVYFTPNLTGTIPATVANSDGSLVASVTDSELPASSSQVSRLPVPQINAPSVTFNTGFIPPEKKSWLPTNLHNRDTITCAECGQISLEGQSVEEFFNQCHGEHGHFCETGGSTKEHAGNRGRGYGHQGQGNKNQHSRNPHAKNKGTKVEQHLNRTANIIRAATAIVTVVVTVGTVIRAYDDLSNRSANKANAKNQHLINQTKVNEILGQHAPKFADKNTEALFNHINPSGNYYTPKPSKGFGARGNIA